MTEHGTYRAGSGWFDSSRKAWVNDPAKLTEIVPGPELTQGAADEVAGWGKRKFKENPELEALIQLRDSSKPEDRANYDRIVSGAKRMAVGQYEQQKAEA
ncbi:hypothetical protein ACFUPZ_05045 [Microbacterium oxydans]|uniref:hypothetical protein n=1 Tax=Microbacterium oxydans TaxID=82380 RepID=UPI003640C794